MGLLQDEIHNSCDAAGVKPTNAKQMKLLSFLLLLLGKLGLKVERSHSLLYQESNRLSFLKLKMTQDIWLYFKAHRGLVTYSDELL